MGLSMLCLDLVTMTRGEGGNSGSWVSVEVDGMLKVGIEEWKRLF